MKLKEKMDLIESLKKRIEVEPMRFRELNAELSELKKDVEEQLKGMWCVTKEEENSYIEQFEKGGGLFRDDDCCYFERDGKYPIRVERGKNQNGSFFYTVESVPFTGY